MTIYLDATQWEWLKAQPRGTLRVIVADYMEQFPEGVPVEEKK